MILLVGRDKRGEDQVEKRIVLTEQANIKSACKGCRKIKSASRRAFYVIESGMG